MASKKKKAAVRPRHREGTEQSLREAVGDVLAEEGLSALSVSNVATRAGVDKALIYRYFGGLEALIADYASSQRYWPTVDEIIVDRDALLALPFFERFAVVMRRYASALRARPATIAVLAAELTDRMALPAELLARREQFGLTLLELTQDAPADFDTAAVATLVTGSIHYLLIRATQVEHFNGIPLSREEGWKRVEAALDLLLRNLRAS